LNFSLSENHIATFTNYFSDEILDRYINHFDYCSENKNKFTYKRERQFVTVDENVDLLTSVFYDDDDVVVRYINVEFLNIFFNKIYPEYLKKYEVLNSIKNHTILELKIQKTLPEQGYHVWHCENMNLEHRTRICAFILYLNDVEEGGETEFLYQKTRIKPERNKLILWPTSYTHIHRGNPPLSGKKYVLTGWVEAT